MTTCPDSIKRLIEHFDMQADQVRSPDFNETQLRIDFVNPMFAALGWDMDNAQRFAEQYREVVHEDRVKVGGQTKAPDYSFRVGGTRKYFLEAKKPFVNIKTDWEPAYQLRRYGWSAKLAVSLLTDFEELSVYDCRIAPKLFDKASVARREYLTYHDYPSRWDFIEGTFSKRAVLQGEFDRYCQTARGRGAQEFDDAFLEEIEDWRKKLASNLALRNDSLDERSLNFAVQRIIDRIIFLRICEDRAIEHTGQLQSLLSGESVYPRLFKLFHNADARYNSGLFHFKVEKDRGESPDELTEKLEIDDDTLKSIIKRLYYPDSPYEFTVVSADILGSVYERFLGKIITLTPAHRAKVEEKPEVRKAGGVYYTPTYIVDYIVQNTVGKLLGPPPPGTPSELSTPSPGTPGEGRGEGFTVTPKEASKLKILDPACGSGSFLLGAYQYLLDWHLKWYIADGPEKWNKGKSATLRPGPSGDWRLTIKERKRILLDNIHGVDIDFQAVEVTKLSLLLRVLEGETAESLGGLWKLFRERALPDLGSNIQCGNSLIGSDIMATDAWKEMSEKEKRKINPFDFEHEFSSVFKQSGFDAVIGNPPWGAELSQPIMAHLATNSLSAGTRSPDTYAIFIERSLTRLRTGGFLGFITPDTFLRKDDHSALREHLLRNCTFEVLCETGPLFSQVRDTWCAIFSLRKQPVGKEHEIRHIKLSRFIVSTEDRLKSFERGDFSDVRSIPQEIWIERPRQVVAYLADPAQQAIIRKIERHPNLGQQSELYAISRGEEGSKFDLRDDPEGDFAIVIPDDVERYTVGNGKRIASSSLTKGKIEAVYSVPKLWIIRIQKMRWKQRLVCGIDLRSNSAAMKTLQSVVCLNDVRANQRLKHVQGILASRLINFWCINYLSDDMNRSYLLKIPVPKKLDNRLVACVERVLELYGRSSMQSHPQHHQQLQREIESTDSQIDQLVYELYGLTADEIQIVEEATV